MAYILIIVAVYYLLRIIARAEERRRRDTAELKKIQRQQQAIADKRHEEQLTINKRLEVEQARQDRELAKLKREQARQAAKLAELDYKQQSAISVLEHYEPIRQQLEQKLSLLRTAPATDKTLSQIDKLEEQKYRVCCKLEKAQHSYDTAQDQIDILSA